MKFFHLSDLHIRLKLMNRDLREDQEYILDEITELARRERPDAVVIAGDIYDKAVPSAEAVEVFDRFLVGLTEAVPDAVLPFQIHHMSYHIGRKHLNSRRECCCIKFHIRKFIYRKMQKYGRHISCKYTNCFILRRRRIFHFFFKTFPNLPYPFSGCHGSAKCQIRIYI